LALLYLQARILPLLLLLLLLLLLPLLLRRCSLRLPPLSLLRPTPELACFRLPACLPPSFRHAASAPLGLSPLESDHPSSTHSTHASEAHALVQQDNRLRVSVRATPPQEGRKEVGSEHAGTAGWAAGVSDTHPPCAATASSAAAAMPSAAAFPAAASSSSADAALALNQLEVHVRSIVLFCLANSFSLSRALPSFLFLAHAAHFESLCRKS
jgi:hypothetical protein